nr:MAG TPA: Receptor Binding Protein [Caudoviricetes sp.]
MAFTCGFFNSENGDRKYNAEQMSAIFDGIIADGVFTTIGDHMAVSAGTGMQVLVGTGKAWFDHTWNVNDAAYPLAIAASDVTLSRIDVIVLETNHSDSVRLNKLRVVQGTVASSPVKPTLTNSEKVHQHPLAWVTVAPGVTKIAASAIENAVGTSACPFVTGVIATTAIDDLFNQWNGEFDEWFDNLKAQLSDNVVANLQKQIDELKIATGSKITNATASTIGVDQNTTVDAAINTLGVAIELMKTNKGYITLSVADTTGAPIPGIPMPLITDKDGVAQQTNENGIASGYISEGTQTIEIKDYADIIDYTDSINIIKGNFHTKNIIVTTRNFLKITASRSLKFSSNVSAVDVTAVGGGGGGDACSSGYDDGNSAGGGGGGYCTVQENVTFQPNTSYKAIVGAGGDGFYSVSGSPKNYPATDGGSSSFLGVIAGGGKHGNQGKDSSAAGAGNGRGGYYTAYYSAYNAVAGSVAGYSSFTETVMYGGGGSGVWSQSGRNYTAAAGYGGNGDSGNGNGVDGFGGGGSAYGSRDGGSKAGDGGSGCIAIRMHLKSAA